MWLCFSKPGFLTQENLRGVRVPYAKPMQLFIVVNLLFYMIVTAYQRTDYTPSAYDNNGSNISDRPFLKWTSSIDSALINSINDLRNHKLENYDAKKTMALSYSIHKGIDPKSISNSKLVNEEQKTQAFFNNYDQKVSFFSKTLIFLLIPLIALLFYAVFYRKLKYYGSALILATHFLTFNLLFYTVLLLVIYIPYQLTGLKEVYSLPYKALEAVLYNQWMEPFSNAVFGIYRGYEAMHIIAWGIWMFIAFKRLFDLHWLLNLLISYLLARLFFILVFSFYKKFLIAFTLWNM